MRNEEEEEEEEKIFHVAKERNTANVGGFTEQEKLIRRGENLTLLSLFRRDPLNLLGEDFPLACSSDEICFI